MTLPTLDKIVITRNGDAFTVKFYDAKGVSMLADWPAFKLTDKVKAALAWNQFYSSAQPSTAEIAVTRV